MTVMQPELIQSEFIEDYYTECFLDFDFVDYLHCTIIRTTIWLHLICAKTLRGETGGTEITRLWYHRKGGHAFQEEILGSENARRAAVYIVGCAH